MKQLPKVLYATTNLHKIRLFKLSWKYLKLDKKYQLITLQDLPKIDLEHIKEDSGSFEGDAKIKAIAYAKAYNLPTISQDRGFVFKALNWPGTDTKKAFLGNEEHVFIKGQWKQAAPDLFEKAKLILAKIDGKSREMEVVQGLAISLPNGKCITQEYVTKGIAADTAIESVSGFGGMYEWFFIPKGLNQSVSSFPTKKELDNFCALVMYPITNKIVEFLEKEAVE